MIEILDKSKCVGCHACYSSCPRGCLSMQEDNEDFCIRLLIKNNEYFFRESNDAGLPKRYLFKTFML